MSLRQLTAGKMAISLCRAGPPRLPLTGRSTSRSGSQRSVSGSLSRGHGGHGGLGHGQGGLGSSSRAGSRRQSTASVHSSASSTKSMGFGMRRYEREREQRLRRQQQLQNPGQGQQGQQGPSSQGTAGAAPCPPSSLAGLSGLAALGGLQTPGSACSAGNDELGLGGRSSRGASPSPGPSPNPLSPMSTDKLLPALDQLVEDVVWTTQSSSQRQDNVVAGQAGPSGYRPLHVQRAEMRSERARHLHAQLHSAQLHAGHLQQQTGHGGHVQAFPFRGNGGALAGLALSAAGPSSASAGAAGPSTSAASAGTSPDGR